MKPIEWRQRAEEDVAETAAWLARQGGLALGQRFIADVEATLARISDFPAMGSARHCGDDALWSVPLRFVVLPAFNRYLVYYLDQPGCVEVVRIWCADRGLQALMDDTP